MIIAVSDDQLILISMDKVVNLINLTGWVFLLVDLEIQYVFHLQDFLSSDINFLVLTLRCVQLFQIFDMVLILLGKSKGNLVASFFQILGRLIVCMVFVQPQSHRLKFAGLVVFWSIADINRYLYYLYKDNPITSFLRYNSFLVLYPLGVLCEMLVINDYIQRHADLKQEYVIAIRVIQVLIVGGMLFLYKYMLSGRKKWALQKLENGKKKQQSTKTE